MDAIPPGAWGTFFMWSLFFQAVGFLCGFCAARETARRDATPKE